jgi:hypothetical protein
MNNSSSHGVQETRIPIGEKVRMTNERLDADFSRIGTKLHRFPRGLRSIGDRYIVPSFVALGPYHHGLTHLQEAEEVKHAAAHDFCARSGHSVEEVHGKILSIVADARRCYADVVHFGDAEFAAMMFLDGCFLLEYMHLGSSDTVEEERALLMNSMVLSTGPCMLRDIFLLENQLPWLVLETLMEFGSVGVFEFVSEETAFYDISDRGLFVDETYRPPQPHILGLLRYYHINSMSTEDISYELTSCPVASSAIELAEMGIHLIASNHKTGFFADMSIQKRRIFGELSLKPLFLNDITACWFVNMAAFEACTSTRYPNDGFVISSYLSLLAMLMVMDK